VTTCLNSGIQSLSRRLQPRGRNSHQQRLWSPSNMCSTSPAGCFTPLCAKISADLLMDMHPRKCIPRKILPQLSSALLLYVLYPGLDWAVPELFLSFSFFRRESTPLCRSSSNQEPTVSLTFCSWVYLSVLLRSRVWVELRYNWLHCGESVRSNIGAILVCIFGPRAPFGHMLKAFSLQVKNTLPVLWEWTPRSI